MTPPIDWTSRPPRALRRDGSEIVHLFPPRDAGAASAATSQPATPPALPALANLALPPGITVVTDLADLMWSVLRTDVARGTRETVALIQRLGDRFEVTLLGDPIRLVAAATMTEATAVAVGTLDTQTVPSQRASRRRA